MNENRQIQSLRLDDSLKLYNRAIQIISGGSQTSSKRPDGYAPGAFPIYLEQGEGCRVFDVDGNEYIDFNSGLACLNVGHTHPMVVNAIKDQLAKYIESNSYESQYLYRNYPELLLLRHQKVKAYN